VDLAIYANGGHSYEILRIIPKSYKPRMAPLLAWIKIKKNFEVYYGFYSPDGALF
jgi:hypothetical protein